MPSFDKHTLNVSLCGHGSLQIVIGKRLSEGWIGFFLDMFKLYKTEQERMEEKLKL